ncbi:MAG: ATP-binding protein, partial [Patescibacteria group bacterium]
RLQQYDRKLSGPIMDRIDLWLEVPEIDHTRLKENGKERSEAIRGRVEAARARQAERFKMEKISTNAEMGVKELKKYSPISEAVTRILEIAAVKMSLSPRAYHRVIKLARTIADLGGSEKIEEPHMLEALTFRPKIR